MTHFKNIRQTEAAECGLACLAIVSGMLGAQLELAHLRRKYPVSARGLTMEEIMSVATAMDMISRPLRCDLEELGELSVPCILHWGLGHFVVLVRVRGGRIDIHDPAQGLRTYSLKEVSRKFTGIALELSPSPAFRRRKERSPLNLPNLFRATPAVLAGLAQTLLLSLLLQVYVVASPFYMQIAIDEAALKGDRGLLSALALGFGLFAIFNVVTGLLRSIAVQRMSSLIGWDMKGRLFHHMIRLPLPWFQRRRLADALTRFESIEPVRALFSNGLVSSVIDGALAAVTLIMMFVFAWKLAVVAVAALLVYMAVRAFSIPLMIRLGSEALNASIAEQGKRIEVLRAMQTIKVMGAEVQREGDWANKFAETVRTGQSNALTNIGFSSAQGLTDAVANVAIIYLGAMAIIDNELTVGVLYAFMSYKGQFSDRSRALFETMMGWKMLDIHSERIADIALTPVEAGIDKAGFDLAEMNGGIEIRNLSFRYGPQEPFLFRGIDASIAPGEFVAIVGPSGTGKSTLLKVICGLYPASAGEVRVDGMPLEHWGPRALRRNLGVVMQDDELLAGSIADNVCFFSEAVDMEWVWRSLAMASIDEEVRAMPMQAETLVGDMGSALSGGQKQRLFLARAFYRRPKILILDEATSHLDVSRERLINAGLKSSKITRLVVAHRPETIAAADRVLVLDQGRLHDVSERKRNGAGPSFAAPPYSQL